MTRLNWRTVDRYLAGDATAEEQTIVERWLANSAAFRRLLAELHRSTLDDEAVHRAAAEVRARLERDVELAPDTNRHECSAQRVTSLPEARALRSRSLPVRQVLKAAAAVTVLLAGSLLARRSMRSYDRHGTEIALRTIIARAGQLPVSASLPDSSLVILSPGSTLRYATTFGPKSREVQLEGEAYFDVCHDASRPFVVRARDLVAEDLGTEFVVRRYPEDPYGQVIVRKGRVGIGGAVITPGRLGRLTANGTPMIESADTVSWFAWTRGQLLFKRTPLRTALPQLSRWYDVEFRLADPSFGDRELSGPVPPHLDDNFLKALEVTLGLRLTREGRILTFWDGATDRS